MANGFRLRKADMVKLYRVAIDSLDILFRAKRLFAGCFSAIFCRTTRFDSVVLSPSRHHGLHTKNHARNESNIVCDMRIQTCWLLVVACRYLANFLFSQVLKLCV